MIPSGDDVLSIIGPDCVVEKKAFTNEINYLRENGFNVNLIKISPKCHVVSEDHIMEDKAKYVGSQGSTAELHHAIEKKQVEVEYVILKTLIF